MTTATTITVPASIRSDILDALFVRVEDAAKRFVDAERGEAKLQAAIDEAKAAGRDTFFEDALMTLPGTAEFDRIGRDCVDTIKQLVAGTDNDFVWEWERHVDFARNRAQD
ncbi:MAG: hypothetical protein Q4G24_10555 [Paracoccus sp. (in: a-proteobacteria)]|uniref:hypothetical protein n=1 Tax=Paracoccus sp. TaxID=267 RepID=UPI0026DF582F|nr:hypothetical protein [Paracoccus sp. (in: a-proteobacteria)]MDO5621898.1 hypothetical protein [Paracoccus sp. (in: a-proteobacteria)]